MAGLRPGLGLALAVVVFPLYAEDWTKEATDRTKRASLHDSVQKVRGDSGRWSESFRMQHAPPLRQKPAQMSLDDWAEQLRAKPAAVNEKEEHWLLLRTEQLDDNDRVWVERIERRGMQIRVVANRAKWRGKYFRNFTYYPVIALNLGKLEPGKYEVKWVVRPFEFTKFDGDGKPLDTNWPLDEKPTGSKPAEYQLAVEVRGSP